VNVICDNALVSGFAAGVKPVGARIVREVCDEFDLGTAPGCCGRRRTVDGGSARGPEGQYA
jgi:hypothetical protein